MTHQVDAVLSEGLIYADKMSYNVKYFHVFLTVCGILCIILVNFLLHCPFSSPVNSEEKALLFLLVLKTCQMNNATLL